MELAALSATDFARGVLPYQWHPRKVRLAPKMVDGAISHSSRTWIVAIILESRQGFEISHELSACTFRIAGVHESMAVTITEKAAGEIKRVITEQHMPAETVLRIGVAGGGCSGFQYNLGFDNKSDQSADHVTQQHGIAVAVDKKSYLFLDGTTVDFYEGLEKRGFTFDNPNAVKSCGCGSSFSA